VAGVLGLVLLQATMITWLLLERRRRLRAQADLEKRLLEVIHLNRTAMAGALSASVAHELNQPLAAIQANAEAASIYLKANPPDIERLERILEYIRRDDRRAADIISHLRGLLKKKDAAELQEFDLNDVVRDALHFVRPEALKRGVEVKASTAKGTLPVRGDPVHLQQVILNLAMNGMDAMQACARGRGEMSIHTARIRNTEAEVVVADSGTGVPSDKLNTIFDTFYTTKHHGTGLGLPIARTIVETYGGKIWAENRPEGGATFRFTVPVLTERET
jgi:signal transduction histidine kinase